MSSSPFPELGSTPADALFPVRVAAIDVGSNAIRFTAAEFVDPTHFVDLDYVRAPVRMGHEAFRTGRLPAAAMNAAVSALAGFARRMEALSIAHYRAVATSAVRDSSNGEAFVERVRRESGIRLEAITGMEEARLVWLAVRERVDLGERRWVLADLGGGSMEVSLVDAERIHWSESHPVGTVRVLEEIEGLEDPSPARVQRLLENRTAMLRDSSVAHGVDAAGLIATGGNIEVLAELAGAPADPRGVRTLPLPQLREVLDQLARLSPRERSRPYGLRADRADVIVPAAMLYERIALLAGAEEITVPAVGVKDGVHLDLVADLHDHGEHERRIEQIVAAGALAVGRRYAFEERHARQVARLGLSLFDQTHALHGLGEMERHVLLAATLLHDIGQFISYRRHHKHSHYLISNGEIPGLSPAQIRLVALVARYHRGAEPKESHPEYAVLPREDRERVRRLAALLRLADALDRGHGQQVASVEARASERELELVVAGLGDLLPEQWALRKKAPLFEDEYGLAVRFTLAPEEEGS